MNSRLVAYRREPPADQLNMQGKKKRMTIEEYLSRLSTEARALTDQLRGIIQKALPAASEEINPCGNPTYAVDGNYVAWIANYKSHVDLGFFMGARLHSDLLEGTGKTLRHIKVKSVDEIREREFVRLLQEASKLKYTYGR